MKIKRGSLVVALIGFIGISLISFPTNVHLAWAGMEPIDTVSFSGTWKRNPKRSDDPREKFKETMASMRKQTGPPNDGFRGGGRRGGGGRQGGGGRRGASGRRGGEGARRDSPQGIQERMGSLITVFESLDIKHEASEFHVNTGERLSIYYLDGKKHQRNAPDGSKVDVTAEVRGLSILIKAKTERGFEVNRTFELSQTGEDMFITVNFKGPRNSDPVTIKTVYELTK